jgi:hypothetical protein
VWHCNRRNVHSCFSLRRLSSTDHMIMVVKKFQDLSSATWRTKKTYFSTCQLIFEKGAENIRQEK